MIRTTLGIRLASGSAAVEDVPMLKTILVPLDGSERAERALPYAAALAQALHGQLVLLHVRTPATSSQQSRDRFVAIAELNVAAHRLRRDGLRVEECVYPGHIEGAGRAIAECARDRRAELLAMATHARGGLARLTTGSVATGVLQRADVPLLLIRPAAMRQPAGPNPPTSNRAAS